jgi:recombination protein RecR
MDYIDKVSHHFSKFPGIGPRQAKRFVYFLLHQDKEYIDTLLDSITDLRNHVRLCTRSWQHFYARNPSETLSPIERDPNRDQTQLLIVERDSDLEAIEKSGVYHGLYFVLGGTQPILEESPKVRLAPLQKRLESDPELQEVILATSLTPDGERTHDYIKEQILPITTKKRITLSTLGRGLSTGTELEYIDRATMASALSTRHTA